MVAEPQEPLEQAQLEERREAPAQGPVHPSAKKQPEGKPRCITQYFKFMKHTHTHTHIITIVHYVFEII